MNDVARPRTITYFADFTCPFSYVTEAALWRLSDAQGFELRPRAFELFPSPDPPPDPPQDAAALTAARELASDAAVILGDPLARPRTRKAHEAVAHAQRNGADRALRAAIYRSYWEDGSDIARIDLLVRLGEEVGIDPTGLKIALDIDAERESVLADLDLARRLRVAGVPTLFIGTGPRATVLQGARSTPALDEAIRAG